MLRPITPADEEWLYRIYASTREEELAALPWDAAQKEAFLRWQAALQHRWYQQQYAQASFQLILWGEEPIGRLYVQRGAQEIRIIDIALLPAYRRRGIGTHLIQQLLAEGQLDQRAHRWQEHPRQAAR